MGWGGWARGLHLQSASTMYGLARGSGRRSAPPPSAGRGDACPGRERRQRRLWAAACGANAGTAAIGPMGAPLPLSGARSQIQWQVPSGYSRTIGGWGGDLGAPWDAGAGQLISRDCFWVVRRVPGTTVQVVWLDPVVVPVRRTRHPRAASVQIRSTSTSSEHTPWRWVQFSPSRTHDHSLVPRSVPDRVPQVPRQPLPALNSNSLSSIHRGPRRYPPHSHPHDAPESLFTVSIMRVRALRSPRPWQPHRLLTPSDPRHRPESGGVGWGTSAR